jgi:hypothetical protein
MRGELVAAALLACAAGCSASTSASSVAGTWACTDEWESMEGASNTSGEDSVALDVTRNADGSVTASADGVVCPVTFSGRDDALGMGSSQVSCSVGAMAEVVTSAELALDGTSTLTLDEAATVGADGTRTDALTCTRP